MMELGRPARDGGRRPAIRQLTRTMSMLHGWGSGLLGGLRVTRLHVAGRIPAFHRNGARASRPRWWPKASHSAANTHDEHALRLGIWAAWRIARDAPPCGGQDARPPSQLSSGVSPALLDECQPIGS